MKDGIDNYNFVAFSKYLYMPSEDGYRRLDEIAPTEKEEIAYRKYLRMVQVDPISIVKMPK